VTLHDLLPWVTSAVGILIIRLARRKSTRRVAWGIGIANQGVWISYALAAKAYGFIAGSVAYGVMYTWNLLKGD
jgi:hypothetical protein